jgi:CO dehydrogenase/acetyl-CoA synthase alpha subunit
MSEEPLENDSSNQNLSIEDDISQLSAVAIQINEVYSELKKAGFTPGEALNLAGMVLTNFILPVDNYYYQANEDIPEGFQEDDEELSIRMEYLDEDEEDEDY